ncbi:hypothetical protein NDU88_006987 [Pleurodeles waltl]|uniref:Uncharacterized protein n=1 Tax=Pleurodeles waltl TaxID=8319 RepID=A0AAV7QQI4_PLEWA|nr:hypothetical protein NDU88_006987 [Pleurodeles waltl]
MKEPTGGRTEEKWNDHREEETEDAWNPRQKSGPEPTPLQSGLRGEDRWPMHMSEPATLEEKRGHARCLWKGKKEEDEISGQKREDVYQPLP